MVTLVEHSTLKTPHAVRTLIYVVVLLVFAVLNPLACVWHCALQDHMAEQDQQYVWLCATHQFGAGDMIVDSGSTTAQLSAGTLILAVHQAVISPSIRLVLATRMRVLGIFVFRHNRTPVTIVPIPPPPKSSLRIRFVCGLFRSLA
jgi:hypothetical protein